MYKVKFLWVENGSEVSVGKGIGYLGVSAAHMQNRFLNPFFGFEVLHDTDPRIKQFVDGAELT